MAPRVALGSWVAWCHFAPRGGIRAHENQGLVVGTAIRNSLARDAGNAAGELLRAGGGEAGAEPVVEAGHTEHGVGTAGAIIAGAPLLRWVLEAPEPGSVHP